MCATTISLTHSATVSLSEYTYLYFLYSSCLGGHLPSSGLRSSLNNLNLLVSSDRNNNTASSRLQTPPNSLWIPSIPPRAIEVGPNTRAYHGDNLTSSLLHNTGPISSSSSLLHHHLQPNTSIQTVSSSPFICSDSAVSAQQSAAAGAGVSATAATNSASATHTAATALQDDYVDDLIDQVLLLKNSASPPQISPTCSSSVHTQINHLASAKTSSSASGLQPPIATPTHYGVETASAVDLVAAATAEDIIDTLSPGLEVPSPMRHSPLYHSSTGQSGSISQRPLFSSSSYISPAELQHHHHLQIPPTSATSHFGSASHVAGGPLAGLPTSIHPGISGGPAAPYVSAASTYVGAGGLPPTSHVGIEDPILSSLFSQPSHHRPPFTRSQSVPEQPTVGGIGYLHDSEQEELLLEATAHSLDAEQFTGPNADPTLSFLRPQSRHSYFQQPSTSQHHQHHHHSLPRGRSQLAAAVFSTSLPDRGTGLPGNFSSVFRSTTGTPFLSRPLSSRLSYSSELPTTSNAAAVQDRLSLLYAEIEAARAASRRLTEPRNVRKSNRSRAATGPALTIGRSLQLVTESATARAAAAEQALALSRSAALAAGRKKPQFNQADWERRNVHLLQDPTLFPSGLGFEADSWMGVEDVRSGRWARWDALIPRQESQDSQARDSGIETGSAFTSSEDSNRGSASDPLHGYHHHCYQKKVCSFCATDTWLQYISMYWQYSLWSNISLLLHIFLPTNTPRSP